MTSKPVRTGWAWIAATFFGIGRLPGGPGTWASLATAILWFFIARAVSPTPLALHLGTVIALLVVFVIGVPVSLIVERESGTEDPGYVVIDEVAGQLTALSMMPVDAGHVLLAFVLFRLFDIVKPPPVRQFERLHGGLGIMVDDVAAGIYALLVALLVRHWW